jgi:hypothetical protein
MKRRERRRGGQRTGGEQAPRRRSPHRSETIRILIVGEGKETEPHYFYGLRNEEAVREKFIIEIRKGKGGSSLAVMDELNKYWRREIRRDYEKNDEQLYARLQDRTETALDNARKVRSQDWASTPDIVDCNSASDVYLLVQHLLGAPG